MLLDEAFAYKAARRSYKGSAAQTFKTLILLIIFWRLDFRFLINFVGVAVLLIGFYRNSDSKPLGHKWFRSAASPVCRSLFCLLTPPPFWGERAFE